MITCCSEIINALIIRKPTPGAGFLIINNQLLRESAQSALELGTESPYYRIMNVISAMPLTLEGSKIRLTPQCRESFARQARFLRADNGRQV